MLFTLVKIKKIKLVLDCNKKWFKGDLDLYIQEI